MTGASLLHELREMVRTHALVLGLVVLAMVLAYGYAATTFAISIDEDNSALGLDWTPRWLEQGRPVIPLVKLVLADTIVLPFFDMALALVLLLVAGVLWAAVFLRAARPGHVGAAGLLLFLVVFTTMPVNAYYLAFDTFNVEVSLAWASAAASVWLAWRWAAEDGGPVALAGSSALGAVAMLTYQDFTVVVVAGVVIAQLADLLGRPAGTAPGTRAAIRRSAILAIPVAVALAITAVVSLILVERDGQVVGQFVWGTFDAASLIGQLTARMRGFALGDGFPGGWVLQPTIAAGVVLVAIVAFRGLRDRRWYPLALLLVMGITPFGLAIAIGQPLPVRAMQTLVLVSAGVWLLVAVLLSPYRFWALGPVLLVMAALFAVWHGGIVTRSFVSEHQTYEADRAIAREIGERLVRAGWDPAAPTAIVTIGQREQGPLETFAAHELIGFSLFNDVDGRRSAGVMRMLGYPLRHATAEETTAARERARTMPDWPAAGSVVLVDGVAVVRFSGP